MSADDGSCSTVTESPRAASPEGEAPAESPTGGQKCALPSPPPSPSCLPPAAKRSRRAVQKRVVSVQLGDAGADHRPKGGGEGPPPPDSWAWRKYGQKPIKGSPYPRGYYRCSSSKGCPARKQVERSRADPTVLLVTYTFEHNHPWPLPKNQSHPNKPSSRPPAAQKPEQPAVEPGLAEQAPEPDLVQEPQPEPEPERERQQKFVGLVDPEITTMAAAAGGEEEIFNCWFDQPSWDSKLYAPVLLGALDVAAPPPEDWDGDLQGEDALFAGLGELPECAVVFGRRRELGLAATAPWCS